MKISLRAKSHRHIIIPSAPPVPPPPPGPPGPPANTVLPVITGSLTVGSTLTCSTGTWTNSPSSYSYQWFEGGSAVGTNANTYVSTLVSASISCIVTASNANGSGSATALAVGPVLSLFATPTLSNFSALGASPLVLQGSTTDYVAGYRGQLQIATDSGFVTITQNQIFFIDGASWASNSIATGLVTPAGQYWSRWRLLRDNDSGELITGKDPLNNALSFNADVSAWSNTFTDTITASVAVLSTVPGVSKNAFITITGSPALSFAGTNGVGAAQGDRATIAQAADYAQFEITLTNNPTASGLRTGWEDGTSNLGSLGTAPGSSNNLGVDVKLMSSGVFMNWNSDGNGGTLSASAPLSGDTFSYRIKKSTHAAEVWRTRSGTTIQMGTTQTVPTLSAYFAWVGPLQGETGTANFGPTFVKALDLGAVFYG